MDPRIARWAKTLVEYCLEVKPGESVQINATSVAEPLVTAVYREIVRAGGHPVPSDSHSSARRGVDARGQR